MKKLLLSFVAIVLSIGSAQADVTINEANFPDENFRWSMEGIDNGDGVLTDEEIAAVEGITFWDVQNFKGIEYFYHLQDLLIFGTNIPDQEGFVMFDISKFTNLASFTMGEYHCVTSLDFSKNSKLKFLNLDSGMSGLTTIKLPAGIEDLTLNNVPKLSSLDLSPCQNSLVSLRLVNGGDVKKLDLSNFTQLNWLGVFGEGEEGIYPLTLLDVSGCENLWSIELAWTSIETLIVKDMPHIGEIQVSDNEIKTFKVENCEGLTGIGCNNNDIWELNVKNCQAFFRLDANSNKMRTLIIDESPNFQILEAMDNQLMWLDMSKVVKDINVEETEFRVDNQNPSVTAWKLSPTEVGLRVHERMDPGRMLNLKTNGKSVTATETTIDGIRYIVFSNDGANAESLNGKTSTYEYETKWPYAWMDGNSKDNNLPVTLTVTKVEKLPSWIKLSSTETLKTMIDGTLTPPTVTRSDKYDGKLTWTSSNENVVKVDADGKLTIIGPGTATITVTGAETDYRTAPEAQSYKVIISPYGDADGNGKLDANDIVEIVNYLTGKPSDNFLLKAADANKDNKVDIADIIQIANTILAGK